jgi:pimeloyl-ACP methyl ester carboxylesterase
MISTKYFFFHYGPGGNCDLEREWIRHTANLIFWDQPKTTGFTDLVEASCLAYRKECERHGAKLNVIGHSFGCDVLGHVLKTEMPPDKIIFLSPITDIYSAFLQMAMTIIKQPQTKPDLASRIQLGIQRLRASQTRENFWALIAEITQFPDFAKLYWASETNFQTAVALAGKTRGLDFDMWKSVLDDYLSLGNTGPSQNPKASPNTWIYLGAKDPYYRPGADEAYWQKLVPSNHLKVLPECGHYPHLETQVLDGL